MNGVKSRSASTSHALARTATAPAAAPSTTFSVSSLADDPRALRAESEPHGDLALAHRRARELQVRDIRAHDQQHEAAEHEEDAQQLAEDPTGCPAARAIASASRPTCRGWSPGSRARAPRRSPAPRAPACARSTPGFSRANRYSGRALRIRQPLAAAGERRLHRQRHVEVEAKSGDRAGEALGGDADHRVRLPVQDDPPPDDLRIGAEARPSTARARLRRPARRRRRPMRSTPSKKRPTSGFTRARRSSSRTRAAPTRDRRAHPAPSPSGRSLNAITPVDERRAIAKVAVVGIRAVDHFARRRDGLDRDDAILDRGRRAVDSAARSASS